MKKPRLPKEPKAPKAAKTTAGSNTLDPEKWALFLKNKDDYAKATEKKKKAVAAVRNIAQTIKADGFSLRQIKLAIQLESPEGEAKFRSLIANDLLAAQYAGAQIGSQLQLFLWDVDRTPSVDQAFDEGLRDAMANKAAKPAYDPSTPMYSRYLDGFHSYSADIIKKNNKPTASSEMN